MDSLKQKVKDFPKEAGVYLFKDKRGEVLYVGKAKNLKVRVSQYFGQDKRPQLPYLVAEAEDVDYIVVGTELESLFLENTLIKQYLPPYNIKLRDDKNYAFIKIDYSTEIPQITYVRKLDSPVSNLEPKTSNLKPDKYFGPYSSTRKIRQTLDFVRRIFPYCANKQAGKRPCFYYYLHRCPGICVGAISMEEYYRQMENIALFLSGKTALVRKQLAVDMKKASATRQFERAAKLRDQIEAINILDEKHLTQFAQKVDWDFVSVFRENGSASVNLFKVREGKLIDKENFIYQDSLIRAQAEQPETENANSAVLERFLEDYYVNASSLPQAVFAETNVENVDLLKDLLKTRAGHGIPVSMPVQGQKLKLIKLGKVNAQESLRKWQASQASNMDVLNKTLEELQTILKLPKLPRRIEGYDISNTQGTNPVGSMVVFEDGQPAKSQYRKFKIKSKDTPDDFAMMREMLSRRLNRIQNSESGIQESWAKPDLIVIDGGKGQLKVAKFEIRNSKLEIPVIGLAKRIEEVFLPNNPKPIILSHDNPALQLLQRLRDEAHRFAITFHRSLRSKAAVKSELDSISGIGPKTKKLLKQKFGTIANIRDADSDTLTAVVGSTKANLLKKHL